MYSKEQSTDLILSAVVSGRWGVLDFETTHLPDFRKIKTLSTWEEKRLAYPEPVSVAIVDSEGNTVLNTRIKPLTHEIMPGAQEVHGISKEMVKYSPVFADVYGLIKYWVDTGNCFAYNRDFDMNVFRATCDLYGLKWSSAEMPCAMHAYGAFNGTPGKFGGFKWWKLTEACAQEGLTVDVNAHDALADVKMTHNLILHMAGVKA